MKLIKILTDIFFMTRPILFVPVWAFALLGYYRFNWQQSHSYPIWQYSDSFLILLAKIMVFTLSVGAVNIFNQIADVEADEANDGFSVFQKSELSVKLTIISALIISIISVFVPLIFKWDNIYLFSVAAIVIGILYSFRPTYFTGKPIMDFVSNAIGFGVITFGVGWVLAGGSLNMFIKSSLPYTFLMCAGSISSTLPDIKGDKVGGKLTTAVWLGESKAHILASIFIALSLFVSIIFKDNASLLASLFSFPVYFIFLFWKKDVFKEATYKIGGLMLMLIVAVMYPLFIPFSIILFVATIVYFRLRFHVSYPSLLPVKN